MWRSSALTRLYRRTILEFEGVGVRYDHVRKVRFAGFSLFMVGHLFEMLLETQASSSPVPGQLSDAESCNKGCPYIVKLGKEGLSRTGIRSPETR